MGHFCVNCGGPLEIRVVEGREVEACAHDDFVLWHDPKVATLVVVESPRGLVLGQRGIEPGYGRWCFPGGFVNDDESPAFAAARECREEIEAPVDVTGLIGVYHGAKSSGSSIVVIAYRGRVAAGETPRPGGEMLEVGVFAPDAVPPLAFPSHRAALEDYLRLWGSAAAGRARAAGAPARPAARPSGRPAAPRRSRRP